MKKTLVLLASAISISSAFAQTPASAPAPAMAMAAASSPAGKARHEERVEERISYLHTQLKITPQQETQWNAFADVMRNNGETMGKLFEERRANKNISALDDMKQYADIAQAHADGTKKL
ncbi:MAG TPA: Spy/CpxP family protein refolding chaperone, partial [Paraburkholderia sp.]|nr:Spy/CpxP family protein refolding chaperone [Paraburkholderia sp.]